MKGNDSFFNLERLDAPPSPQKRRGRRHVKHEAGSPASQNHNEDTCAVCLSPGEDTMLLPCAHQFHGKCILRWVDQNYSCPLCRQEISQFVPLNSDDPDIHQKFVEIWERHHYGLPSDSDEEQDAPQGPKDRFDASKNTEHNGPPTVSFEEVKTVEELEDEQKSPEPPTNSDPTDESNLSDPSTLRRIEETVAEVLDVAPEVLVGRPPTPRRTPNSALVFPSTSVLRLRSLSTQDPVCIALREARYRLRAFARNTADTVLKTRSRLRLKGRFGTVGPRSQQKPLVKVSLPRSYDLGETLEAGFFAGAMTASLRAMVERPAQLYPLVRSTIPNVAIFFTVFEDLKKRSLSSTDGQCEKFAKRTVCAAAAATAGQLPVNRFKLTVPLRFGLQFGFFELFKDQCCINRNLPIVDHSQLQATDIALCALSGGVLAASAAFPLEIYMGYMSTTTGSTEAAALGPTYRTFMKRFLPGCVFTAMSFEYGRRFFSEDGGCSQENTA